MTLVLPHDVQRIGFTGSLLSWMGKLVYPPDNPNLYRVVGVTDEKLFLQPVNKHDPTVICVPPRDIVEYGYEENAVAEVAR
jgi:hypothetical protein